MTTTWVTSTQTGTMMAEYKDLKIDGELRDIAEDVADQVFEQDFGSIKAMGHEAVILWLVVRAPDDVVDDVLEAHGYDTRTDLIDAVRDRQFQSKFAQDFDPVAALHTPSDMDDGDVDD